LNYRISLVIGEDGSTMAHVHELMGCFALSSSKNRALEKLVAVIPQYHQWLAVHEESTTVPDPVELTVVEEVHTRASAGSAGGPDPLRECDRVPATNHDIESCLKLLKHTRDDLNQVITKLPKTVFSFKPKDEPRSVRNTLRHIADVEVWYLSRINADPPLDELKRKNLLRWLKYTRSLVEETLPNLTAEQLNQVFYPSKWSDASWPWTATKVVHRLVTHERQHTSYLKRIINLPSSPLKYPEASLEPMKSPPTD
jgi:uncharacterized damage-inducible protein DinB